MIGRRGFLAGMAGIIAAGVAPAIVKQPMKIYVPPKKIITPLAGLGADFDGDTFGPLHFGNMAWKPELSLVLPIARTGRATELTVQPMFKHVTNLPVMGVIRAKDDVAKVVNLPSRGNRNLLPLTGLELPKIRLLNW